MSRSPQRIGRYTILRTLPPGGMAQVYVARKDGRTDICVLKRMRMGLGNNPVVAQRFIREAQVAALLDHPHIAKVFEASVEGESLCMAVEFIRGHDLAAIMYELSRRGVRVPFGIGVAISIRVLDALFYAHGFADEHGRNLEIVHRDIGPRNVMIGFDGTVKIIDFGLAKAGFGHSLTASGVLLGTPRYMAPEQARGEEVDARADVYAVALTLYELITGRAVVTDTEPVDALRTVLESKIPPLSQAEPRAPKELSVVLEKALAKERKKRHSNARELRDEVIRAAGKSLRIASEEEIAAFMIAHFPDPDAAISSLGKIAREIADNEPAASSDAETVVVAAADPFLPPSGETLTVQDVPVPPHQSIDLAIPPPRPRGSARRSRMWRSLAYVLAVVAIVMMGLVAYQVAAGS
jgi:eukaryotic-like serine/threonine-protein kinase